MTEPLLAVEDLRKHYPVRSGVLRRVTGHVKAVDGVGFALGEGETLGLVGESGCGKSTTATTVLGIEEPTGGSVRFDGRDVTDLSRDEVKAFRRRVGMIFQDPTTAFDPRMTVGESVAEPLEVHGIHDTHRQREIVADTLVRVGMSAADADRYPDAFSGGQKQRIALARALVTDPDVLVADEPVSALDVSVQAEILSLLEDLRADLGLSMLLISHDLGVVRQVCDRVAVMYLGEIVERGPTEALFADPQHPYTEALIDAIPEPDPRQRGGTLELTGDVPDPSNQPPGCSFHPRCPGVVPPEDLDIDQGTFRRVLDFRLAVESGDVSPADDADAARLRERHDLPATLDGDGAETALAGAIEDLLAGDSEAAVDRLEGAFATVCEEEDPALGETPPGHEAACHLHDPPAED